MSAIDINCASAAIVAAVAVFVILKKEEMDDTVRYSHRDCFHRHAA